MDFEQAQHELELASADTRYDIRQARLGIVLVLGGSALSVIGYHGLTESLNPAADSAWAYANFVGLPALGTVIGAATTGFWLKTASRARERVAALENDIAAHNALPDQPAQG
jgi:hypothetical protein